MTVHSKINVTLANLKGVIADFDSLYIENTDRESKELFSHIISEAQYVYDKLKDRVDFLQKKEAQYKEGD